MLYVKDNQIYTLERLLKALRIARAVPPSDTDLVKWGVYKLQPDVIPEGDVVKPLQTASLAEDGKWYRDYSNISYTAEELSKYKRNATQEVSEFYQKKVDSLTELYPAFEQSTWTWQYEEALALQADPQAPSPIIDKVVQWSSGFTKTQYVTYLLNNIPVYKNIAGKYIGLLVDAKLSIKNATTKAEIDSIVEGVRTS